MGQGGRCQRCEELEAEVAVLKGELGLSLDAGQLVAVRAAYGLSKGQARVVLALYLAGGKPLSRFVLERALRGDDADPYENNTIAQFALQVRARIGRDFIETVNGLGYMMPPASLARVLAVLHPAEAA